MTFYSQSAYPIQLPTLSGLEYLCSRALILLRLFPAASQDHSFSAIVSGHLMELV